MNKKKNMNRDPLEVENSRKRAVRIQEIREILCNGDNAEFSAKMGFSKQYASGLCTASERITDKTLEKILKVFPEVSRSWLFFGEGEMLRSSSASGSEGRVKTERSYSEGTPDQVAILRALLEDKERQLAEANQLIGKLRLQLQIEREKASSFSAQMQTERI